MQALQVHPSMVALFNVMHFHPAWWTCNVKKFHPHGGILTFWWLKKFHRRGGIVNVTQCHHVDGIVNVKKFHHRWVHLEVTLEMQSWKVDTPISNELITAESENILENIAPSQRHNNVQLTGKSFLKNSNTGGPDINVTRGNLYDKVVLELETNFEQVWTNMQRISHFATKSCTLW